MNPLLEKLELQFADLQAGRMSAYDFFNALWAPLAAIKGAARDLLNRVYAWAKENEASAPADLGLATVALGLLAMHEDRIEDGLKLAVESHKIFDDIKNEDGLALSNLLSAAFYRTLGNVDAALKYQYSVSNQLQASGKYPFFLCASCYQLGELYVETKAYDRAIVAYDDCAKGAEQIGNVGFRALALDGKALAYHYLGKKDLAQETFLKAIPLLDEEHFSNQLSRIMSDYGTFSMDNGDYEKAIEYHQQALTMRVNHKMLLAAITNMIQLGKVYQIQSKHDEALAIWQKGLETAININAKPKISQLHLLLSEFYQNSNDTAKSLYHYKAYHDMSEEVNREDGEKKVKRAEILFAAEQTEKENTIIKAQKAEIEQKKQRATGNDRRTDHHQGEP